MSNTNLKWEANPQGVRKIVMELVAELDPTLLSSPAVEKCIIDLTSYANQVANKAREDELMLMGSELGTIVLAGQNVLEEAKKHISWRLKYLRTKTGEE